MSFLNIGCGYRYNIEWINIDLISNDPNVKSVDISKGIPFKSNSFSFVYSSHLLEHLSRDIGLKFVEECYRVLQPDGIIRIVVPDLEKIAKIYLEALEKSLNGSVEWQQNYNWILLEMFDQINRINSGGKLREYLTQENIPNKEFVINRIGNIAKEILSNKKIDNEQNSNNIFSTKTLFVLKSGIKILPFHVKEILIKILLGKEYELLKIGRFRERGGEIHKCMYDRYSLSKLLRESGFTNIILRSANESYMKNWHSWNLDTNYDGSICKPDSLYLEAKKSL